MPSSARRTYYMHTLDGKPASFSEKDGALFYRSGRATAQLVDCLAEIRRHQALDREWCAARHMTPSNYGYVRVEVPDAE